MADYRRIGKAVSWNALDLLTQTGLNFIVLVLLARWLQPADFGLVAMLTIFIAMAQLLIESGFSQALIQRQQATHTDESTIFFFTLMMGAMIALLLCAAAPAIAKFYDQPLLRSMTCWMALNLFLNTFGVIHTTLLQKKLDFKTLTKVGVLATLVSSGVALGMAASGWGVWSLVGRVLVHTIGSVILLWLLHAWRPIWSFSLATLRSYFRFGGWLLWTGLLNTIYTNLYTLLIGKMHSVQDVGYYTQARRLQQIPIHIVTSMADRVTFPIYASIADEKQKIVRGLSKATTAVVFITMPLMLAIIVLAEPIILLLLGEKWAMAAPVLQALAIAGVMAPLNALNLNVLKAQGHSALNARIQIVRISIAIGLLLAASPFGILAIAYGQALASLLAFFVNAHYTRVFLNYGARSQLREIFPYLAAALTMATSMWLAMEVVTLPQVYEMSLACVVGAGIYLLIAKLARFAALTNIMQLIQRK